MMSKVDEHFEQRNVNGLFHRPFLAMRRPAENVV